MKYILSIIKVIFLYAHAYALPPFVFSSGVVVPLGTNWLTNAACEGAWYMNSAGDATELDVCTASSEDLVETEGDTVAQSSTVPSGYSGNSKAFVLSEDEGLTIADGNNTDISGADAELTICAWVKHASWTGASSYIVSKFTASDDARQYRLRVDSTGYAKGGVSSGTAGSCLVGGTTESIDDVDIGDTNWHHICMVYDDVNIKLYVDGDVDLTGETNNNSAHTAGICPGNNAFYVGMYNPTAYQWDGLIDEVIILSTALSPAEITGIYIYGIDGTRGAND